MECTFRTSEETKNLEQKIKLFQGSCYFTTLTKQKQYSHFIKTCTILRFYKLITENPKLTLDEFKLVMEIDCE